MENEDHSNGRGWLTCPECAEMVLLAVDHHRFWHEVYVACLVRQLRILKNGLDLMISSGCNRSLMNHWRASVQRLTCEDAEDRQGE